MGTRVRSNWIVESWSNQGEYRYLFPKGCLLTLTLDAESETVILGHTLSWTDQRPREPQRHTISFGPSSTLNSSIQTTANLYGNHFTVTLWPPQKGQQQLKGEIHDTITSGREISPGGGATGPVGTFIADASNGEEDEVPRRP